MSPPESSGVSRCAINARMRSRCWDSPDSSTLLVRSSATTLAPTAASAPCADVSELTTRTMSAAEACSRRSTSISASPPVSMRWMMRTMRFTLDARSEMISMFEDG